MARRLLSATVTKWYARWSTFRDMKIASFRPLRSAVAVTIGERGDVPTSRSRSAFGSQILVASDPGRCREPKDDTLAY